MLKKLLMLSVLSIVSAPARAQDSSLAWAARLETEYRVVPNITYLTLSNYEAKLDLYVTRTPDKPLPTLIWIHGGGWTGGVKETSMGIPAYLAMGMNVVNVEYRLARTALAPAAVEDCRCAPALGDSERQAVRDRRQPPRRRRRIGRRPSGADDRYAARAERS